MSAADTDTYRCCAVNEYGKAVCTATLTVTDGEFFSCDTGFSASSDERERFNGSNVQFTCRFIIRLNELQLNVLLSDSTFPDFRKLLRKR